MAAINYPTWALNASNDLYLDENGNIATITGAKAVVQTINNELSLWLAEYDYNTAIGVNYNGIMGQLPNQAYIDAQFRASILSVQYVSNIQNLTYLFDDQVRKFTVNNTVKLSDGTVEQVTVQ